MCLTILELFCYLLDDHNMSRSLLLDCSEVDPLRFVLLLFGRLTPLDGATGSTFGRGLGDPAP